MARTPLFRQSRRLPIEKGCFPTTHITEGEYLKYIKELKKINWTTRKQITQF